MLTMMNFQSTSPRPIIWYSLMQFGIRTMVANVRSVTNYPVPNYIREYHIIGLGEVL